MKKILLIPIVIIIFAAVWWSKTPHTVSDPVVNTQAPPITTPEQILANDYERISRNLKPENISNDEWKKINTYSLAPEKIVTKENASSFFKTAQKNLPDIYTCLKKDFCGMETKNAEDAYFDDEKTPAHILINRNLKIMRESLLKDSSLASQVDWDLMRELANSNSEMLSVEALDIIGEFDTASVKTDELVKMTQDYKGTTKAEALLRISKNGTDKVALANDIQEVFATSDADTVISVLEKVGEMKFDNGKKAELLKNLCWFKTDSKQEHNWLMIKSQARKIYPDFEKICN